MQPKKWNNSSLSQVSFMRTVNVTTLITPLFTTHTTMALSVIILNSAKHLMLKYTQQL